MLVEPHVGTTKVLWVKDPGEIGGISPEMLASVLECDGDLGSQPG